MIELKVFCDCGQKYKFEVQPVNNQMPFAVACPVCKADGTAKANAMLAQMSVVKMVAPAPVTAIPTASFAPAVPHPPPPHVAVAVPPIAVHPAAPVPLATLAARMSGRTQGLSQEDRDKAEIEARAKILWGDKPDEVIRFLMLKGFAQEEASEKIHAMIKERHQTIRVEGIKKIIIGSVMAVGSAGALLGMWKVGFLSPFVAGGVGLACVGGLWMLLNGLFKFLWPGSQSGDATEND